MTHRISGGDWTCPEPGFLIFSGGRLLLRIMEEETCLSVLARLLHYSLASKEKKAQKATYYPSLRTRTSNPHLARSHILDSGLLLIKMV